MGYAGACHTLAPWAVGTSLANAFVDIVEERERERWRETERKIVVIASSDRSIHLSHPYRGGYSLRNSSLSGGRVEWYFEPIEERSERRKP